MEDNITGDTTNNTTEYWRSLKEFTIKSTPPVSGNTRTTLIDGFDYEKSISNYNKRRKTEVPIFDPVTGEANLDYEKLTGKKNPLLDSFKPRMLLNLPIVYEPKQSNRFLVKFPTEFKIKEWVVRSIEKPKLRIIDKKIFGFKYGSKSLWSTINITLLDSIGYSSTESVFNINQVEPFTIHIEMLDPTGVVVEDMKLVDCRIKSIDYGYLGYTENKIHTINLEIQPKNIKLIKK